MAKRRYKKRRSDPEVDAISLGIVLFALSWFGIYKLYILPNLELINHYAKLFVVGLWGFLILLVGYFLYRAYLSKKQEKQRIAEIPDFLRELENKIKTFKPIRQYKEEKLYQAELVGYLKHEYPEVKIEETRDYSRPDIIIDDIAIEIKWPTDMSALKTLPDKINRYIPKWNYLFIVLFSISITDDPKKNREIYLNKKQEILTNIIESKKDKVFIVEIF